MSARQVGNPTLIVVAGPQGAGKSTFIQRLKGMGANIGIHVQTDFIVEWSKTRKGKSKIELATAKKLSDRFKMACVKRRKSFSFETVLDREANVDIVEEAKKNGYFTALYFIGTEGFQLNIERIKHRVSRGGHDVPYQLVAGDIIKNKQIFNRALDVFNNVRIYDNTKHSRDGLTRPVLLAKKKEDRFVQIKAFPEWLSGNIEI